MQIFSNLQQTRIYSTNKIMTANELKEQYTMLYDYMAAHGMCA